MDIDDARVVRHLNKFEDVSRGLTPEEYHWRHSYPYPKYKCVACGAKLGPGALVATSFMPLDEFKKRSPVLWARMVAESIRRGSGLQSLIVTAVDGIKYLRASTSFACKAHAKDLEVAAAKGPSWVFVDWDRGLAARPSVFGPSSRPFDVLAP